MGDYWVIYGISMDKIADLWQCYCRLYCPFRAQEVLVIAQSPGRCPGRYVSKAFYYAFCLGCGSFRRCRIEPGMTDLSMATYS